jgi:orotate phosphoribosyltransferase
VTEEELLEALRQKGAVMTGHFLLSSGRHSDTFVQKFRLFEDAALTMRVGEMLAERFAEGFDVVAAPAVGAIVLGFATAVAGRARSIFCERVEGRMIFRRGFNIEPGERAVVVEDVITTGGSAAEVVDLVRGLDGEVLGVGALVDRGDASRRPLGAPLSSLVTLEARSWPPDRCPLCAAAVPIDDPGSRRLGA